MDDVLRTVNICLYAFGGIVFGRRNLLQRGSVNDVIHTIHSLNKTVPITYVTYEIAHAILVKILRHLELFELIPGINDQLPGPVPLENGLNIFFPERAGTARDENRLTVEHF